MKVSQTFIPTLREVPNEAVIASHQLMLRAALIRKLGNGLFAYLPLGLRAFKKVEQIIREEIDRIGGLECKQPFVVPGELWQESGRWDKMGDSLLKAQNRLSQDLVMSPTAEEAFTALLRDELSSYKQLPLNLYQINTKYRDEIRPRYGVMRGREFTMKDAYSFHTDQASLDSVYNDYAIAYRRIFKRLGLSVISVSADSGAMGGSGSEEFMVESAVGDDTLILCNSCDYAANTEKAICAPDILVENDIRPATNLLPEEIATPNVRTIEELVEFLHVSDKLFIKTLIYRLENANYPFIAVCIRGDLDVNEAKLAAFTGASLVELAHEDDVERITKAPRGFAGPVGLVGVPILVDNSVQIMHDAVTGGLKKDVHLLHVEPTRDFTADFISDVRLVREGDLCPHCGTPFYSKKGNELGHIFKLGDKYSISMNLTYLDSNGVLQYPLMGCYGIGVDRALASIIEEHHDKDGIIWPLTVAPYAVVIVPIKYEGEMKTIADSLYADFQAHGVEVLLDERNERPGVRFKDMDLLGIPYRIVVGEKNLPKVELKQRKSGITELIEHDTIVDKLCSVLTEERTRLNDCSDIGI